MGTYKNIWIERVSGFVQGRVAVEFGKNWADKSLNLALLSSSSAPTYLETICVFTKVTQILVVHSSSECLWDR